MQHERKHEELSDHELLDLMVKRVRTFLRTNGLHILTGLAIIGLVVVGIQTLGARGRASNIGAWESLSAQRPASYFYFYRVAGEERSQMVGVNRKIVAETPRSTAAPFAVLRLASLQMLGGDWEGAEADYGRLLTECPDHPFASAARAGRAAALEEMGQYTRAADVYRQLAGDDNPHHWLSVGRCQELAGDTAAARRTYIKLTDPQGTGIGAAFAALAEAARIRQAALDRGDAYNAPPALKPPTIVAPDAPAFDESEEGPEEEAAPAETPSAETPVADAPPPETE